MRTLQCIGFFMLTNSNIFAAPYRSNGWGHGTEGWDDGGGGYDDAMSVGDGRYYVTPMQARIGMDMAFESRVRSVAMCVSQLYLLEQVLNQGE